MENSILLSSPNGSWSDHEWDLFSKWIKSILHFGSTVVTFTKKDGTTRVMKCTLDPALLPPAEPLTEGKTFRKDSGTAIRVFDLGLNEWRSFTVRSVQSVTFS